MVPVVSVLIITFNHEAFLREALDSVLMQVCSFPFDIRIGDDCSTDKTRDIILEYAGKYPDKIFPVFHEKNLGPAGNLMTTCSHCKGRYIAVLEGDDYWTNPQKLSIMVDHLERHPEQVFAFHSMEIKTEKDFSLPMTHLPEPGKKKKVNTLADLVSGMYFHMNSTLFRNNIIGEVPERMMQVSVFDHCLFLLLACHGDAGFVDEVMGVYRVHGTGVHGGIRQTMAARKKLVKQEIIKWECLREYAPDKLDQEINRQININLKTLLEISINLKEKEQAKEYFSHIESLLTRGEKIRYKSKIDFIWLYHSYLRFRKGFKL